MPNTTAEENNQFVSDIVALAAMQAKQIVLSLEARPRDLSDSKAHPGQTGGRQSSHRTAPHRTDDGPSNLTVPLRTRPSRRRTCHLC